MAFRPAQPSWWFRDRAGKLILGQFPNPALWVWAAAWVLGRFDLSHAHEVAVTGVRHGALVVWSVDEIVRGSAPFRRVLGAAVLAAQLIALS